MIYRLAIRENKIGPSALVRDTVLSRLRTEASKLAHGSVSAKNLVSASRASAHVIPSLISSPEGCLTQCQPCLCRSRALRSRRSQLCSSPAGMRSGFVRTATALHKAQLYTNNRRAYEWYD